MLDEAENVLQPGDHRLGVHATHGRIETWRTVAVRLGHGISQNHVAGSEHSSDLLGPLEEVGPRYPPASRSIRWSASATRSVHSVGVSPAKTRKSRVRCPSSPYPPSPPTPPQLPPPPFRPPSH